MNYEAWIDDWLAHNNPYGKCAEAAKQMQTSFPELTIVRGHVECGWGRRAHIWLVEAGGQIVDPTALQYPSGVSRYDPWCPGDKVRVGSCMNCGDGIWRSVQSLDQPPPQECACSYGCRQDLEDLYG